MRASRPLGAAVLALSELLGAPAWSASSVVLAPAGHYPMYASWPQPGGPGLPLTLTYAFSSLLDGGMTDAAGTALPTDVLRGAFGQALADYAAILPIHFVELVDAGPFPETGDYDPSGLADIRIGHVPHVDGANAYAWFPMDTATSGLAGDIVFNARRFGFGWSATLFYGVAQHELGHSLGIGHYVTSGLQANARAAGSAYDGPLFPFDEQTIAALQAVYGAGTGSVTPLSAVPEPAIWALLLSGLPALGWVRMKCRTRTTT